MDKNKIKKEYNQKIQNLVKLNKHYYDLSKPLVNDHEMMRNNNQYLNLLKKGNKIKKIVKFPSITSSFLKSKIIQDLHFTSSPPTTRSEIPNFSQFAIECRSIFLDEK